LSKQPDISLEKIKLDDAIVVHTIGSKEEGLFIWGNKGEGLQI
jgi:hypothetical protein